jgi:hypothetical protein
VEFQMHDISDGVWSSAPHKQAGVALVRATIEEFRRATVASERYEALRGLGASRAAVCRRIFEEVYALTTAFERRG